MNLASRIFNYFLGKHNGEAKYYLLFDFVCVFVVLAILFFIITAVSRIRKTRLGYYEKDLLAVFEDAISEVLFAGLSAEEAMTRMMEFNAAHLAGSKKNQKIICREIVKLRLQFTGEAADRIKEFYAASNLIFWSFKKLGSEQPHLVVQGIGELSEMGVETAYKPILQKLGSPRREVSEAAQLALIKLKGLDALDDMQHVTTKITDWQQINITSTLLRLGIKKLPDLSASFQSGNPSLVVLAVKLVCLCGDVSTLMANSTLLLHPDPAVRNAYIWAIGEMHDPGFLVLLTEVYDEQNTLNKIEIIKSIARCGNKSHAGFVKEKTSDPDEDIAVSAKRALAELSLREPPTGAQQVQIEKEKTKQDIPEKPQKPNEPDYPRI